MRQSNLFCISLNCKILAKIFRDQRIFSAKMFANRQGDLLVFIDALMQVLACESNSTCIAQFTFKMANKGLLVHDRRPRYLAQSYSFSKTG